MIMIIPACMKRNDPLHCVIHLASTKVAFENLCTYSPVSRKNYMVFTIS